MSSAALAAPPPDEVRRAYDRGKTAYDSQDFATAAHAFAEADALVPNRDVLELAIVSAAKANDPIFGMQLVDRAEGRGHAEIAREARETFIKKVGRIEASCVGATHCSAKVDGEPLELSKPIWFRVGDHSVVLESDGNVETFQVRVVPFETTMVRPARVVQVRVHVPAAPAPVREERSKGVSPIWFYGAAGATVLLGAATVFSGVDTMDQHEAFANNRSNADLASAGRSAELRTNILLASTGVLAVGSAVLGLFFVNWQRSSHRSDVAYVAF